MRKIEDIVVIIASYKSSDVDKHVNLFNQLTTEEMQMCVDHYDQFGQGTLFFTMNWRLPFVVEINRRKVEQRDNKLNELGI